ncbi:MAG: serine--tRNA ligase [Candidatus Pacearchaeota archaeon]
MLDIKLIRENPKEVKESLKKRGLDFKDVDLLLELDKKWRDLKKEVESLRAERNKISEKINEAKKQGKKIDDLILHAKELPKKIEKREKELIEIENKREELLEKLPNLVDKSVPVGSAEKNKVLKVIGKIPKFTFEPKGHEELLIGLDCLDIERAAKVAGARFYYLKRELVKLNQALINYALDFLAKKGFILIQPPYMLRRDALKGAINLSAFEEMIYKIENEDLYLIGTAEHALNAYYMNETLQVKDLPIRFAGISPCFRKEAGAHGKDTKGIFRIHQFEKVEQFVFCKPEQASKEFDLILKNSIELYKGLGIPFRVVLLASEDLGRTSAKTVDLEGWFPGQNAYRELGSCSNCLDYQARRSNIKYEEKGERKYVYTLNNTAIATERMLTCLVENYQQKDGSIRIPKVLQKYCGFKIIKFLN